MHSEKHNVAQKWQRRAVADIAEIDKLGAGQGGADAAGNHGGVDAIETADLLIQYCASEIFGRVVSRQGLRIQALSHGITGHGRSGQI